MSIVVMILEKVPQSLRGELSKWLIEPKSGVFVGKISAIVRDKLWEKCVKKRKAGSIVQIWQTNTEQGFQIRTHGDPSRTIIDYEGLFLVKT